MEDKVIVLGAGCFWAVQEAYVGREGIVQTEVGFSGGSVLNPTYDEVCLNETGHVEVLFITYSPDKISFEKILDIYFYIHDPTQVNRQGRDIGRQYRSVIFYTNGEQKEHSLKKIEKEGNKYRNSIKTEVVFFESFYKAEEYHQHYLRKNKKNRLWLLRFNWFIFYLLRRMIK